MIITAPRHIPKLPAYTIIGFIVAIATFVAILFYQTTPNARAGAPICTWTGGGGPSARNFSNASNWSCEEGTVPVDGTSLVFPGSVTDRVGVNDLSQSIVFSGVTFTGSCDAGEYGVFVYELQNFLPIAGPVTNLVENCFQNTRISLLLAASSSIELGLSSGLIIENLAMGVYDLDVTGPGYNLTHMSLIDSTYGDLTGSGTLSFTGLNVNMFGNTQTSSFSGSVVLDDSNLYASSSEDPNWVLGTSSIIIGNGSDFRVFINGDLQRTFTNDITVSGNARDIYTPRMVVSAPPPIEPQSIEDILGGLTMRYESAYNSAAQVSFSGQLVLLSDLTVSTSSNTQFTGVISGAGYSIQHYQDQSINIADARHGSIIVNGSTNNTDTPNDTYEKPLATRTTVLDLPGECVGEGLPDAIFVGARNKVVVNSTCSDILLRYGGILGGTGTVGNIFSEAGVIASGNSPGVLDTGNLDFDSETTVEVEIAGTGAGEYDQLNVTGTVDLGSATLNTSLLNDFVPLLNDSFTIINNDGTDAVTGTFAGLANGATFTVGEVTFTISYVGGTGNDVVLTATTVPGPPDTSGIFPQGSTTFIIAGILVVAGVTLVLVQRRLSTAQ